MNSRVLLLTLVLMLSLVLAAPAIAATSPVASIAVQRSGNTVSFSGVAGNDVAAVAVLLYDPAGVLMRMGSVEVASDDSFAGSYEADLSKAGVYSVRASNYDGGPFTSTTFTVTAPGGSSGGSGGSSGGSSGGESGSSSGGTSSVRTVVEDTEDELLVASEDADEDAATEDQSDASQQAGAPAPTDVEQTKGASEDAASNSVWLPILVVLGGGIVAGAFLRFIALKQARKG